MYIYLFLSHEFAYQVIRKSKEDKLLFFRLAAAVT